MKPDWKDAPEWANWLAMDQDGEWIWHEHEPEQGGRYWLSVERGRRAKAGETRWQDTLEQRPQPAAAQSNTEHV